MDVNDASSHCHDDEPLHNHEQWTYRDVKDENNSSKMFFGDNLDLMSFAA